MKPAPITRTGNLSKKEFLLLDLWSSACRHLRFLRGSLGFGRTTVRLELEPLNDRILFSVGWGLNPTHSLIVDKGQLAYFPTNDPHYLLSPATDTLSTFVQSIVVMQPHLGFHLGSDFSATQSTMAGGRNHDIDPLVPTTTTRAATKDDRKSSEPFSDKTTKVTNPPFGVPHLSFTPIPGHGTTQTPPENSTPPPAQSTPSTSTPPTQTPISTPTNYPTTPPTQTPVTPPPVTPPASTTAPTQTPTATSPPAQSTPATQTPITPPIQAPTTPPAQITPPTPVATPTPTSITPPGQSTPPTQTTTSTPPAQTTTAPPAQAPTSPAPASPVAITEPKATVTTVVATPSSGQTAQRIDVQQTQAGIPTKSVVVTVGDETARSTKVETILVGINNPNIEGAPSFDLSSFNSPREVGASSLITASARQAKVEVPAFDSAAILRAPQAANEIFAGDPLTDSSFLKLQDLDLPDLLPELMPLLKADLALVPAFLGAEIRLGMQAHVPRRTNDESSLSRFLLDSGTSPHASQAPRSKVDAPQLSNDDRPAAKGAVLDRSPTERDPLSYPGWLLGSAERSLSPALKPRNEGPDLVGPGAPADESDAGEPSEGE